MKLKDKDKETLILALWLKMYQHADGLNKKDFSWVDEDQYFDYYVHPFDNLGQWSHLKKLARWGLLKMLDVKAMYYGEDRTTYFNFFDITEQGLREVKKVFMSSDCSSTIATLFLAECCDGVMSDISAFLESLDLEK